MSAATTPTVREDRTTAAGAGASPSSSLGNGARSRRRQSTTARSLTLSEYGTDSFKSHNSSDTPGSDRNNIDDDSDDRKFRTSSSSHSSSSSSKRLRRQHAAFPESISWRVSYSWDLLSSNLEKVGVDFFLRLFEERPDLLELFRFGGIALNADNSNNNSDSDGNRHQQGHQLPPALKNHALIVMETLGECVAGLTQLDEIVPKLRAIGKVHEGAGVRDEHYDVLFKHLMEAIAAELGPDDWDGDMREGMYCTHAVFCSKIAVSVWVGLLPNS